MIEKSKLAKKKRSSNARRIIFLMRLFTAIAGTLGWIWFSSSITGQRYEFALHDALVRLRGPIPSPSDVVVVALDEATYNALELPMDRPIPRLYHAKLLKRLAELGAKRVVFDIVFAGQSASPEGDAALADASSKLPVFFGVDHGVRVDEGSGRVIHEITKPDFFLSSRAAGLALVGLQLEDGVARHFFENRDENIRDLVTLSEAGAGIKSDLIRTRENYPGPGDLINFYGKAQSIRTLSLYQVLEEEVPIPEKFIRNKVVFVGLALRTGLGATQKDSFQTPFGDIFGVEIHATQAANLIEKNWIRGPNTMLEYVLGAMIVFSLLMMLLRVRPQWGISILIVIIIGWYVAAFIGLHFNIFLAGGSAVTAIMPLAVIISATFWYLRTYKRSIEIERAFSLYLAPAMVTELKRNPSLLKLGGEEIVASAIFTDIAGFTGISENLGPTRVTAMLNAYFTEIGQAVMEEDGTLIKFIGDAVFALWGAPLPQENHAARACRAAMRIQEVVDKFNERGEFPKLITRVGVHTGKMVVGNLGSNRRFDFTAIGDAVNLSSRVEGVNKYLGTTVLATDDALIAAKETGGFTVNNIRMGAIQVLGREVPVSLFRLSAKPISEEVTLDWKKAIASFTARRWELAEELFLKVKESEPDLSIASDLYISNLHQFKINPPVATWKGEISMEHK